MSKQRGSVHGDAVIHDVYVNSAYYLGDFLRPYALITKSGKDLVCLKYSLYKVSGTSQAEMTNFGGGHGTYQLMEEFRNQQVYLPLNGEITQTMFGGTSQNAVPTLTKVEFYDSKNNMRKTKNEVGKEIFIIQNSDSGEIKVNIKTRDGSQVSTFTCGKTEDDYKKFQYSTTSLIDDSTYKDFPSNCEVKSGNTGVKVNSLSINEPDVTASKASFTVNIVGGASSGAIDAKLVVSLSVPKTGTTGCDDTVPVANSEIPKSFKIYPMANPGTNGGTVCADNQKITQACKCGSTPSCNAGQTCINGACTGTADNGGGDLASKFASASLNVYDASSNAQVTGDTLQLSYNKVYRFELVRPFGTPNDFRFGMLFDGTDITFNTKGLQNLKLLPIEDNSYSFNLTLFDVWVESAAGGEHTLTLIIYTVDRIEITRKPIKIFVNVNPIGTTTQANTKCGESNVAKIFNCVAIDSACEQGRTPSTNPNINSQCGPGKKCCVSEVSAPTQVPGPQEQPVQSP